MMVIENLKQIRRNVLRRMEIRPIHKVLRLLKRVDFLKMENVLEVFGYKGEYHTLDYIKYVKQLDIWEISQDCEGDLKKNLPGANIKITNSYNEIKATSKVFDTIIVDNHQGIFGDSRCEHFEILRDCFARLSDKSVLIFNIIPNIFLSKYNVPEETKLIHIAKRKVFYGHENGIAIDKPHFIDFYKKMALDNGFIAKHVFIVKRNYLVSYFALCLEKQR